MLKTLTTVTWLPEVDALRMRLEAEGIATFVPDLHMESGMSRMPPQTLGAKARLRRRARR